METLSHPAVERIHPPRWLINHLVNPLARRMLRHKSKIGNEILLLRYTGRRTGKSYETPVGFRHIDGRLALLTNSAWRHNFRGGRDVDIVLKGEVKQARAVLVDDPCEVARLYRKLINEVGLDQAARRLGIKLHIDRGPTNDELADMAKRSGLSVIWLDPAD